MVELVFREDFTECGNRKASSLNVEDNAASAAQCKVLVAYLLQAQRYSTIFRPWYTSGSFDCGMILLSQVVIIAQIANLPSKGCFLLLHKSNYLNK